MEMQAPNIIQTSIDDNLTRGLIGVINSRIIKVLLYFDIFHYPLKAHEVFRFLSINGVTEQEVAQALQGLAQDGFIYSHQEFFSLNAHGADISRRTAGNIKARELMPLAYKRASLIAKFPFVRAVMASGSMSKEYMDEKSDMDFFIVTAPNRLFIARTLLVLFKRIFLLNSHKYFCVNYFVDEHHLEIEEKNQFTATELATVIPLYNPHLYVALMKENPWVKEYFPNSTPRLIDKTRPPERSLLKRLAERLFDIIAIPVERFFFALTLRRWKRIYGRDYSAEEFAVAFKTNAHTSKNHPRSFQRKVIEVYDQKISDFNNKHNLTLL